MMTWKKQFHLVLSVLLYGLFISPSYAEGFTDPFAVRTIPESEFGDWQMGWTGSPSGQSFRLVRVHMDRVQYLAPILPIPESGPVFEVVEEVDIQFPYGFSGHEIDQVIHMVMSVIVADVDRDGIDDLIMPQLNERHPFSYQNGQEDGGFQDATAARVRSGPSRQIQGLIPWDANNDGWLDLLAIPVFPSFLPSGYSYGFMVPPPDYTLWLNDGHGNFLETRSIASTTYAPNAAVLMDIDGDHLAELWVSNDIAAAGSGDSITKIASTTGPDFDFLAADLLANDWGRWGMGMDATFPYPGAALRAYHTSIGPSVMHIQDEQTKHFNPVPRGYRSDGVFDRSAHRNKWSPVFCDLDLDGDSDLMVGAHGVGAAGHGLPDALAQGLLVHEALDSESYGLAPKSQGYLESHLIRAMEPVDLDADGRLDFIAWSHGRDPIVLMNQIETSGHWVTIEMQPMSSAHNATGAEVRVVCGEQVWRRLLKDCTVTQSCFRGWVHVGLGDCSGPVEVQVDWPSGISQTEKDLAVDQHHLLIETGEAASVSDPASDVVVWVEPREAPSGVSGFVRFHTGSAIAGTPEILLEGASPDGPVKNLGDATYEQPIIFGAQGAELSVEILVESESIFDGVIATNSIPCSIEAFRVSSVEKDPVDTTDDGLDIEYVMAGGACPGFSEMEAFPPLLSSGDGANLDPLIEFGPRYTRIRFVDPPPASIELDLEGLGLGKRTISEHLELFPENDFEELPELDVEGSLFLGLSFLQADGMDVIPMALTVRLAGDKVLTDLDSRALSLECEGGIEQVWPEEFHIPAAGINRLFVRAGNEPGLYPCSVVWRGIDTGLVENIRLAPAAPPETIFEEYSEILLFAVGQNDLAVAFLPRSESENLVGTGLNLQLDMVAGILVEPMSYRGRGWYGAVIQGGESDTPVSFELLLGGTVLNFARSGVWTSEGEFLPGEVEPNPDSGSVADGEQASSDCACSMASNVHFNMTSVLVLFFATLALYRRRYV